MKKIILLTIYAFVISLTTTYAQSITLLTPDSGYRGQTLDVVIIGSNTIFNQGTTTVRFYNQDYQTPTITVNSIKKKSAKVLILNLTIPQTAEYGYHSFRIINGAGTVTKDSAFNVLNPLTPVVSSISPNEVNTSQTYNISIKGINTTFNQDLKSINFYHKDSISSKLTVNSFNAISGTTVNANVTISSNAILGMYNLELTDSSNENLLIENALSVRGNSYLTEVYSPIYGSRGQVVYMQINSVNGGFSADSTKITISKDGYNLQVNITNETWTNGLYAYVTIPANAPIGFYDVSVLNSLIGKITKQNAFYVDADTASSIVALNPSSAYGTENGNTIDITIVGKNCRFDLGVDWVKIFRHDMSPWGDLLMKYFTVVSKDTLILRTELWDYSDDLGKYWILIESPVFGNIYKKDAFTVIPPPPHANFFFAQGRRGSQVKNTVNTYYTYIYGNNSLEFYYNGFKTSKITATDIFPWNDDINIDATLFISPDAPLGHYDAYLYSSMSGLVKILNGFTVIDSTVGLAKINAQDFNIYPNPANNYVYIECNDELTATLTDIHGRVIASEKLKPENGLGKLRFGEAKHAQGIYLLKIEGKEGVSVKRVVIE